MEENDYKALLAKLWTQPEGRSIDFKKPFVLSNSKKAMLGLVKDILAMANTEGGGYLVIGKDNSGKSEDCSTDVINSFDVTKVHQCTKGFGKPEPKFTVTKVESPEKTMAILICVDEFEEHIIICAQNAHDEFNKLLLQEGDIYIRSKTGNASSGRVNSEQDMRSLIRRSMMKSGQHFQKILEDTVGGYFEGISKTKLIASSDQEWNEEEKRLSDQLDAQLSLEENYLLQILIHPVVHDSKSLGNGKTLYSRLMTSVRQYLGWSFPCPDFELKELSTQSNNPPITGSSDKIFQEGQLQSAFAFALSGLILYREELSTFYDNSTPGKPLFLLQGLVTIYRALGFFGRYFEFMAANERLILKICFTDTHGRIPAAKIITMLNHVTPFYSSKPLPHPIVKIDVEVERGEISSKPNELFFKVARKLADRMEIPISDEELALELEKITQSNTRVAYPESIRSS